MKLETLYDVRCSGVKDDTKKQYLPRLTFKFSQTKDTYQILIHQRTKHMCNIGLANLTSGQIEYWSRSIDSDKDWFAPALDRVIGTWNYNAQRVLHKNVMQLFEIVNPQEYQAIIEKFRKEA